MLPLARYLVLLQLWQVFLKSPTPKSSAGDMLLQDLSIITEETVLLLEQLADEQSTAKKRNVFLINNYNPIICVSFKSVGSLARS